MISGHGTRQADAVLSPASQPERSPRPMNVWKKLVPAGVGLAIVAALERTGSGNPSNIILASSRATSPASVTFPRPIERRGCPEVSELCFSGRCSATVPGGGDLREEMDFFCESPPPPLIAEEFPGFRVADFLSYCYLCRKSLHGKDIYMYRGEKAFCSMECRYQQMVRNFGALRSETGSLQFKKKFNQV